MGESGAAAKDVIELAKASGLYELYVVAPKATVLPSQRPPHNALYSDKNYPEGWADVDPLLSYKSNFDGTILGSKIRNLYLPGQELEQDISMTGLTNLRQRL